MLLDEILPDYDFNDVHTIRMGAPPRRIFTAAREVTAGEVPLLRPLLGTRALLARFARKLRGIKTIKNLYEAPADFALSEEQKLVQQQTSPLSRCSPRPSSLSAPW